MKPWKLDSARVWVPLGSHWFASTTNGIQIRWSDHAGPKSLSEKYDHHRFCMGGATKITFIFTAVGTRGTLVSTCTCTCRSQRGIPIRIEVLNLVPKQVQNYMYFWPPQNKWNSATKKITEPEHAYSYVHGYIRIPFEIQYLKIHVRVPSSSCTLRL